MNKIEYKINSVSDVCYLSMFRVYGCVFCCISLLFAYICMHMTLSPRTIVGVPSGRALPGFPVTAHHLYAFVT